VPEPARFFASLTVPSRVESIRLASAFLVQAASTFRVPAVESGLYEVAVVEALNNALVHGGGSPDTFIVCEFEMEGRCLKVRVLDDASEVPLRLALPRAVAPWPERTPEDWEIIPERGYGLHLISAVFPEIRAITRNGHHGIEMELRF
jgi:anti-sigma regulatory factor (Ser/Thr protein kinase)